MALLNPSERDRLLAQLTEQEQESLLTDWTFHARPKQLAPTGDWGCWNLRAGRGFGKTLVGSSWVAHRAAEKPRRIALVARTPADARDFMIEGPSGLVRRAPPAPPLPAHMIPVWQPSNRRLTWPNGSWATVFSDEEPDQLRGFSGDTAWLDEFAKFKHSREVWENLEFGMREASADYPRKLITSTPRPLPLLKQIEKDPHTITVIGSSDENKSNLDPRWFNDTLGKYRGTRIGRQEIEAEFLDDVVGALWSRQMVEDARVEVAPDLVRIVVAIDPAATSGGEAALTGISVCGQDSAGTAYILEDLSGRMSPNEWGRTAIHAYDRWKADRIVAESNQGGEMVSHVINTIRQNLPVRTVWASKGKQARAEPISALFEQRKVKIVGAFPELEDQMCEWQPLTGAASPDRLDAMVWALTDLMVYASDDMSFHIPQWNSQPRYIPGETSHTPQNPATVSMFGRNGRYPF